MSTNFYWYMEHHSVGDRALPTGETIYRSKGFDEDDPKYHLGKRSGAGLYCWDCKVTLCSGGEELIHKGSAQFLSACPKCHKTESDSFPDRFSRIVGVVEEVRAEENDYKKPTGVAGACSFTWAQDADRAIQIMMDQPDEVLVEDEYGRTYTGDEFMRLLDANCPIHFRELVGQRFS